MLDQHKTREQLMAEIDSLRHRVAELEAAATGRAEAQKALQISEDRWRSYVEYAPYGVFIVDETGTYLHANQAACRITGYDEAELLKMTIADSLAPEFQLAGRQHFQKVMQDGQAQGELKFRTKAGEVRWWMVAAVKLSENRFLGFVNDITDRKQVEEALEKRITSLTQPLEEADPIAFEDLFNINDIQRLQDEFARASGVASIITHVDGTPITVPSNFCRLCQNVIRATETGLRNCYRSDAELGRYHPSGPVVQPCMSGGLWDAGAAISVGGRHVANWLIGQVRDQTQTEEQMRHYARKIGADEQTFMQAFHEVPAMSREKFEQIARALFTLAEQLSATAYQNVQQARFITQRKRAEEALRRSEEQYRLLAENSTDMISRHTPEGIYHYVSPACRKLLDYEPEEMLEHPAFEFLHPEDINKVIESRERVNQSAEVDMLTFRMRRKDGTYVWVEAVSHSIRDEGTGAVKEIQVSARDITERRRMEEALLLEKTFINAIFNSVPGLIYLYDDQGRLVRWNKNHELITGYSAEELAQMKLLDWYKGDLESQAAVTEGIKRTMLTGFGEAEARLQRKDGTVIPMYFTAAPLNINGQNYFIGIGIDITQRQQAEDALRASEKKWRTLFGAMTEMVVLHELVFDARNRPVDYRVIDCNTAFLTITGITREEAVGRLASQIYNAEVPPYLEEFSRVVLTGEPFEYTTYYVPMEKHFVISVVSPQKGQFATITTDITAIKQVEEALSAKNKELENYLYVASHDLRSPLVNIQGFSQRLYKQTMNIQQILAQYSPGVVAQQQLDPIIQTGIPKSLEFIFTNVSRMDALINGLLQISRTGRVAMAIREIDLNHLLAGVVRGFSFQIEEVAAQVIVEDLPPCYGDENLLNQLFSNLISNALKYRAPDRTLIVTVTGQKRYNKVVCAIRDTGIGIDPRHLERIWDVFYRVDAQSSASGEGIGLSIVKRIVDKHKGRAWVESTVGEGSVFNIELRTHKFLE